MDDKVKKSRILQKKKMICIITTYEACDLEFNEFQNNMLENSLKFGLVGTYWNSH